MKYWFLVLIVFAFNSATGKSEGYFQQDVAYQIHVKLDDKNNFLHGCETLKYTNNSPDTLHELFIHLWPNAYKDNSTAYAKQALASDHGHFYFSSDSRKGYIDSLDFIIDNSKVEWEFWEGNWDIAKLILPNPLIPGENLTMETPFRVKIPHTFSRLGHGHNQYQITQWYPKPAVYDQKGWHPIPYLDQGEFYSEFGTYDVYITVPKNYMLDATGDLPQDDPERDWWEIREEVSRTILFDTTSVSGLKLPVDTSGSLKTLHFHQEKVHDFAWFCDKRYYLVTDTLTLPYSKRIVDCRLLFTDAEKKYWVKAMDYLKNATYYYSLWNGDYPYDHVTAVDGALSAGGGMEYPNITVIGYAGSDALLEETIMHEVGHNWYYGILGSNEREHPWMDEGMNSYFENRYWQTLHNDAFNVIPEKFQDMAGMKFTHSKYQEISYWASAMENYDQPIEYHSTDYLPINYGVVVYCKTSMMFKYLEGYLGTTLFDKCIQAYYEKWKFKHPYPEDVKEVFEQESGLDLDWFFDDLFNSTEKFDFKVQSLKKNQLKVKNKSDVHLPVSVTLLDKDKTEIKTLWSEPFKGVHTFMLPDIDFHSAIVDLDERIPELDRSNNIIYNRSLLKKSKSPRIKLLYDWHRPDRNQIFYIPVQGYNTTDGLMLGLGIYNNLFPRKSFDFYLVPMYGFKSKDLTGGVGVNFRVLPKKVFRKIEYSFRANQFADWSWKRNFMNFYFKNKLNKPKNRIHLAVKKIDSYNESSWTYEGLKWYLSNSKTLWGYNIIAEAAMDLSGTSTAQTSITATYKFRYWQKLGFDVRFFGGYNSKLTGAEIPYFFEYGLSGSRDPFGEQYLIDRNKNTDWLKNQLMPDHGNFKSVTTTTFSRYLVSANLLFQTPISMIDGYIDTGVGQDYGEELEFQTVNSRVFVNAFTEPQVYWDAGVKLRIVGGLFSIYFPIYGNIYDSGAPETIRDLTTRISFSLDLGEILSGPIEF
ncbi:M1 family metallopeptidase [bacterium AH-315-C07]|nr:M1 family metallopeptidase [bacterium AH-315-C07]